MSKVPWIRAPQTDTGPAAAGDVGTGFPKWWLTMQILLKHTLHFTQTPGGQAKAEKPVGVEAASGHSALAPSSVAGAGHFTSLLSHL